MHWDDFEASMIVGKEYRKLYRVTIIVYCWLIVIQMYDCRQRPLHKSIQTFGITHKKREYTNIQIKLKHTFIFQY